MLTISPSDTGNEPTENENSAIQKSQHAPSSVTDVFGGDLGLGTRHISVLRGRGVVLHRSWQWRWLMNNQYVVFIVLPQMLLGKVEALHAGDLQLKHTHTRPSVLRGLYKRL